MESKVEEKRTVRVFATDILTGERREVVVDMSEFSTDELVDEITEREEDIISLFDVRVNEFDSYDIKAYIRDEYSSSDLIDEFNVTLGDFADEDLIYEIEDRGYELVENSTMEDVMKFEHFNKVKDKYTSWQMEELLPE